MPKTYRIAYSVMRGLKTLYDNEQVEIYADNTGDARRLAIDFISENRDVLESDTFVVHNTGQIVDVPKRIVK